ncbi:hypothetical protein GvMRE_Ic5g52 [endosymbiont GvMRE of Glomus versiforme]|nr:hypothetical protein GvMRE_Ic5g52 [endosymbiont GvMRE of Glomus versiforme]
MNGIILTVLILSIFNFILNFCVIYYLVNKDCWKCKKDKKIKRIFKEKCKKCEEKIWTNL